jgi:ribosomal protein S18 acetylase RimI-like enzyme
MPSAGGEDTTPTRSIVPRIAATFEESFDSDAESIAATMGISNPKQVIRRLSLNRRCFVAKADGEIIAYGWASAERECVGEMGRQINLRPDEAYVWDCVTLPAFRRQRLYSALLSYIKSALVDDGYRRIWIGSNLENVPSIRGFAIAGYRPAAIITHLRIASLDFLWVSAAREAGPQLATAARDAFSMESDRKFGSLVFGRVKPADLLACIELDD